MVADDEPDQLLLAFPFLLFPLLCVTHLRENRPITLGDWWRPRILRRPPARHRQTETEVQHVVAPVLETSHRTVSGTPEKYVEIV